jgi:nucleotide-binding universal stress UspA family protein
VKVLVPIDGSDCSFRALRFAADLLELEAGSELHVVHFTDAETDATDGLVRRAGRVLSEEGVDEEPEVVVDTGLSDPGYADRIGKEILAMVEAEEFDHVVMGHHGSGVIGRAILGSAAETVVRAAEVPATVIP